MIPMTRPLARTWTNAAQVPHTIPGPLHRAEIARAGTQGLRLPGHTALMPAGHGGYVPVALDPSDPRTWAGYGPVIFT